jgi:EAL domain-containing protein (putative c-di-GMP-specific phosphodiesterase class I)
MVDRQDSMAIVGAVTGLARSLGMGPVAEGVEVSDQLEGVTTAGCEEMQGFYFSRPVPSIEVEEAVARCVSKLNLKAKSGFPVS